MGSIARAWIEINRLQTFPYKVHRTSWHTRVYSGADSLPFVLFEEGQLQKTYLIFNSFVVSYNITINIPTKFDFPYGFYILHSIRLLPGHDFPDMFRTHRHPGQKIR